MSPRKVVPPTTNDHGDDTHPAFAMIAASRMSSTPGQILFDSDIRHGHTVRITVTEATRKRDLNRDWVHGGVRPVVEVEMSEAQWASFVSSMNTSGVPCTLRARETDWDIPGLPYDPRLARTMDEVNTAAGRTFGKIEEAMAAYDALDSKASAKEKREALNRLRAAIGNATANVDFAARSLTEHAENVVQRARADIEAMVHTEATRLGLSAGQAAALVELPAITGAAEEASR